MECGRECVFLYGSVQEAKEKKKQKHISAHACVCAYIC